MLPIPRSIFHSWHSVDVFLPSFIRALRVNGSGPDAWTERCYETDEIDRAALFLSTFLRRSSRGKLAVPLPLPEDEEIFCTNLLYRKDIFDVYQRVLGKDELDQNKFCELMLDQLGDQQYVAEDGLTYLANVEIVYNYNTFYFTTLIQAVCPENRGGSYDLDRSIDPHSDICEAAALCSGRYIPARLSGFSREK